MEKFQTKLSTTQMDEASYRCRRASAFRPGITALLADHPDWLAGRRVALLSHDAAIDRCGRTTADLIHRACGGKLAALFGPEHGFAGGAEAGAKVGDSRHPVWNIPVHSLYGARRKPSPAMLRDVDLMICDLQDIAARPYTYVSTLKYWLETAAERGIPLIVADRPVPLSDTVDGPMLESAQTSFVGAVRTPMVYGMTPGETARWLARDLHLALDLRIAPLQGYRRQVRPGRGWPRWIPPSPRMRSWRTAWCFAATVFTEALPLADNGTGTEEVFQVLGLPAPWGRRLRDALDGCRVPGAILRGHAFIPTGGRHAHRHLQGVAIRAIDPKKFHPVFTALVLLEAMQKAAGAQAMWIGNCARPEFFDKLFGTAGVRTALRDGASPRAIAATWTDGIARFAAARARALLYKRME